MEKYQLENTTLKFLKKTEKRKKKKKVNKKKIFPVNKDGKKTFINSFKYS